MTRQSERRLTGVRAWCGWWLGLLAVVPVETIAPQQSPNWDVTQARGQTREIDFTTSEGTWMSVDISPDGQWIVFDLLGHIYRVPARGGDAQSLTQNSGVALNLHPRYAPGGDAIAFISDRRGQLNLWIMDADGANPRPIFLDPETRTTEPAWTPDGRYVVATRHSQTAVGFQRKAARIWMFPREGGEGVQLVGTDASQSYWPSISPGFEYLYFYSATRPEPVSARQRLQHLQRLHVASGRIERISPMAANPYYPVYEAGSREIAPEISPDGRWLAFARRLVSGTISYRGHRYGPRTVLWIRDLETGAERLLMDPIARDVMDGHRSKNLRVLPGYSWAKDGRSLVVTQGGGLRRVWVETGRIDTIPFTARVQRTISEMAKADVDIDESPRRVSFLKWPASSPNGAKLVFEAVGRLWIMDLQAGSPRPLTGAQDVFELTPAWSPDGQWIAFTTWSDTERGHLWKVRADGTGRVRLSAAGGEYLYPVWASDGASVVVSRGSGATARGEWWSQNTWYDLVRFDAAQERGAPVRIAATGPVTRAATGDDGRWYFPQNRGGAGQVQYLIQLGRPVPERYVALTSVRGDGSDPRTHLALPVARSVLPSPDRRWVAFQSEGDVYVTPLPPGGPLPEKTRIDRDGGVFPVKRLSTDGGVYPQWRNSNIVEFVSGSRYFAHDLRTARTDTTDIDIRIPRPTPRGTIALTGARIITLEGRRVIERGSVVVRDGRIRCVGACDVAGADRVVDVSGSTVVPGFVDVHAHHFSPAPEVVAQHRSESARFLAYGFTTVLDPSGSAPLAFSVAELIEAGRLVGPRTYGVGYAMTGWSTDHRAIRNYDDAAQNVNRMVSWGAVSIKDYVQPRRDQRQWVAQAARQRGVTLTAEDEDLFYSIGLIMDGHAGFEHPLQYAPLYGDASTFLGQAGATYSPTLIVGGASEWSLDYFLGHYPGWEHEKYRRWAPWRQLVTMRTFRTKPLEAYAFPLMAEGVADVWRKGGRAAVGGHGEVVGLSGHWEIWMYAEALEPMEALTLASQGGASFVGLDDDIGSIEVGKVADVLVLGANPLDDIHNTLDIRYVMKGGRLYEAETLDEVWPEAKPYGPRPWLIDEALRNDNRAIDPKTD